MTLHFSEVWFCGQIPYDVNQTSISSSNNVLFSALRTRTTFIISLFRPLNILWVDFPSYFLIYLIWLNSMPWTYSNRLEKITINNLEYYHSWRISYISLKVIFMYWLLRSLLSLSKSIYLFTIDCCSLLFSIALQTLTRLRLTRMIKFLFG